MKRKFMNYGGRKYDGFDNFDSSARKLLDENWFDRKWSDIYNFERDWFNKKWIHRYKFSKK